MPKPRKRYRKTVVILTVTGVSVLLLAALFHGFQTFFYRFYHDFFYPYLSVPMQTGRALSDRTLELRSKRELALEIERLQRENQLLMARFTVGAEAGIENTKLRQLLELERRPSFGYVFASVLTRDPLEWRERFTINRGSEDGIKTGSLVLTASRVTENDAGSEMVFCGVVRHVSRHTAEVLTLIGSEARVAARLNLSDAIGFINADPEAPVSPKSLTRLNFLPTNREYMTGEPVVTAGFEDNIPAGILIGHIAEIIGSNTVYDNRLYVNALITPAADFEKIRFLVVLTRQ